MSILAKVIMTLTGPMTVKAFEQQCRQPRMAQEKLLRHIVQKNRDTAFGRKYGFARIKTLRAFQKRVPICNYEDLKPYIEAQLRGKRRQLTVEKPVLFAMTSGTTGDSKFIPVTPESRKAKAHLMKVWLSAFYKDHPDIFSERILSIVSPEAESHAPDGTPCGAESGHAYRNIPAPIRAMYSCPYEVFEIEDYDARYYTILRIAAAQSLSLIVTANPSTLLVLCEHLAKHTRSIIRDVREGGLSSRIKVPRRIRDKIADFLKPDPARAAELARIAKHHHHLVPKDIWPKLVAIACWKGGTVGSYLEQLRPCFPEGIPIRDLGYLASEQRGSVPLGDDADTGVLAVATNVYEFFPADKDRRPRRNELIGVDKVKLNERYRVYVTTLGGLYRYDMNDIIEVVAFHHKTPMIRFVQKGKGVVSFTGEKLAEAQVMKAVEQAFHPVEGKYNFISAVGEMADGGIPRYAFLTEFDRTPTRSQLLAMVKALEEALCAQNAEYASKRKSLRLGPPVVRVVRRGQFDLYRKHKVENGSPDGQFKLLRITDDVEFAKEFEAIRDVGLNSVHKHRTAGRTKVKRRAAKGRVGKPGKKRTAAKR